MTQTFFLGEKSITRIGFGARGIETVTGAQAPAPAADRTAASDG